MEFDVFISYSTNDTAVANAICNNLESQGIRCWIAPRDVKPGLEWPKAIVEAIAKCKLLVLVFSASSNDSLQTRKEVDCAISHEKTIIPFRIEDVIPTGSMEYYLGDLHWLDALTPPIEAHIRKLANHISRILSSDNTPNEDLGGLRKRPMAGGAGRETEFLQGILRTIFGFGRGRTMSLSDARAARNRKAMLDLVTNIWIKGVLEVRLNAPIQVEIGMESYADAVASPLNRAAEEYGKENKTYPPGSRLLDVFREWNGELLLLGDPGSGKSTSLLTLARDLTEAAKVNAFEPIPVVFNLSSWAEKRGDLVEWLAEELYAKYNIPKRIAQVWIDNDELLLLLDGLDEVRREHRAGCVGAINRFKAQHLVSMVVCCRTADYEEQKQKLNLHGAIVLQPISPHYFDQLEIAGQEDISRLLQVLHGDPTLTAFAQTPLMLNVIAMAYRAISPEELEKLKTPDAHRSYILQAFIQQRLQSKQAERQYPSRESIRWLSRLAGFLRQSNQAIFLEERIQPNWLGGGLPVVLYILLTRMVGSVLAGIFPLLSGSTAGSIAWNQISKITILLFLGLAVGFLDILRLLVIRKIPNNKFLRGGFGLVYLIILGIILERITSMAGNTYVEFFLVVLIMFGLKGGTSGLHEDIRILKGIAFKGRRLIICLGVGILFWAVTIGILLFIVKGWHDRKAIAPQAQLWNGDGLTREVIHSQGYMERLEQIPGTSRLISKDNTGHVDLWDWNGRPVARLSDNAVSFGHSPDGKRIFVAERSGISTFWDTDGNPLGELSRKYAIGAVLPEGDLLVGMDYFANPHTIGVFTWNGTQVADLQETTSMDVLNSAEGSRILTRNADGFHLWDVDGNLLLSVKISPDDKIEISYNHDKTLMAVTFPDHSAAVWDSNGNRLLNLSSEENISRLILDPYDPLVLSVTQSTAYTQFGILKLNGGQLGSFQIPGDQFFPYGRVEFPPDGRDYVVWKGHDAWVWNKSENSLKQLDFGSQWSYTHGLIQQPDQTDNILWEDTTGMLHAWSLEGVETAKYSVRAGLRKSISIAPSRNRFLVTTILANPSIETLGNYRVRIEVWDSGGNILAWHEGLVSSAGAVNVFFDSQGEILGATFPAPWDYSGFAFLWIWIGLLVGAVVSLRRQSVDSRIVAGQGIRLTARNALFMGVIVFVLTMGIFLFLFGIIAFAMPSDVTWSLDIFTICATLGFFFGIPAMLGWGGLDVLDHYILRLMLWVNGTIPRRLEVFLDFAAERAILRKVGGGYMFLHPTILEYFNMLPDEPSGKVRRRWTYFGMGTVIVIALIVIDFSLPIVSRIRSERAVYLTNQAEKVHRTNPEEAYQYALQAANLVTNNSNYLNGVCWYGSLADHATQVLETCFQAVALAPDDAAIRDSRGLARALTGDYAGAIDDFKYYIQWAEGKGTAIDREVAQKRKIWVERMENGQAVDHQAIIQDLR
jgi:hypothetical protein